MTLPPAVPKPYNPHTPQQRRAMRSETTAERPSFAKPVSADEVGSIYVGETDRFVVSLIVGYGGGDGVTSAKEAAHYAWDLTADDGSNGTMWVVYDRQTGEWSLFEQSDIEDFDEDEDEDGEDR